MLQTNDIESHCEKKSSNLSIYFTQVLENDFQYTKNGIKQRQRDH